MPKLCHYIVTVALDEIMLRCTITARNETEAKKRVMEKLPLRSVWITTDLE